MRTESLSLVAGILLVFFSVATGLYWFLPSAKAQVEAPLVEKCAWIYEKAQEAALRADKNYGMMSLNYTDALHFNSEMSRTWSELYLACRQGEVK